MSLYAAALAKEDYRLCAIKNPRHCCQGLWLIELSILANHRAVAAQPDVNRVRFVSSVVDDRLAR